jgi:hypothetical protein
MYWISIQRTCKERRSRVHGGVYSQLPVKVPVKMPVGNLPLKNASEPAQAFWAQEVLAIAGTSSSVRCLRPLQYS